MKQTEKYRFNLIEGKDPRDWRPLNENMEMVEKALDEHDDALAAREEARPGDIRHTMRTSLDDSWLLCNGMPVSTADYPALADVLIPAFGERRGSVPDAKTMLDVVYANGVIMAAVTSSENKPSVICSQNGGTSWTTADIAWGAGTIYGVGRLGERWVACGLRSGVGASIAFSSEPDGNWTVGRAFPDDFNNDSEFYCMDYKDGYFVFGGRKDANAVVSYTKNGSNFTTVTVGKGCVKGLAQRGSIWLACGYNANKEAVLWWSASLDGTWKEISLWQSLYSGYGANSVAVYDNCIVVGGTCGNRYYGSTQYSDAMIAWSRDGGASWDARSVWASKTDYACINRVLRAGPYWVAVGRNAIGTSMYYAGLAYSTSPEGPWRIKNLWSSGSAGRLAANCAACGDGLLLVGGSMDSIAQLARNEMAKRYLPEIGGGSYAYIKGR